MSRAIPLLLLCALLACYGETLAFTLLLSLLLQMKIKMMMKGMFLLGLKSVHVFRCVDISRTLCWRLQW